MVWLVNGRGVVIISESIFILFLEVLVFRGLEFILVKFSIDNNVDILGDCIFISYFPGCEYVDSYCVVDGSGVWLYDTVLKSDDGDGV